MTNEKLNNGKLAEIFYSETMGLRLDGRPSKTDLFNGHQRLEMKFFTVKAETRQKHAEYNSAHGFDADKETPLLEQLWRYCLKFDKLIVGVGADPDHAEWYEFSRKEAYAFLAKRLSHKADSTEIRFCWGGASIDKRLPARLETIRKHGYII